MGDHVGEGGNDGRLEVVGKRRRGTYSLHLLRDSPSAREGELLYVPLLARTEKLWPLLSQAAYLALHGSGGGSEGRVHVSLVVV